MRLVAMFLAVIWGFFQLFIPMPERTDWFQDGEYVGFFDYAEVKTMEKLMELAENGDAESICDVFSMSARKEIEDLPGQVDVLISFLTEEVVSWEAGRKSYSRANNIVDRLLPYTLTTADGTYECLIRDKTGYTKGDHIFGFDNIAIYPEELCEEYAGLGATIPGIFITSRAAGANEAAVLAGDAMEELLSADAEGLCARFREEAQAPEEDAAALLDFLNGASGWEPYAWTCWEQGSGWDHIVWKNAFIHLQTDAGIYRCDLREAEDRFGTYLYSVTVFPSPNPGEVPDYESVYRENCALGKETPGIFLVLEE